MFQQIQAVILLARVVQDEPLIGNDGRRCGIKFSGPLYLDESRSRTSVGQQCCRIPVVRGRIAGVQLDGPFKFAQPASCFQSPQNRQKANDAWASAEVSSRATARSAAAPARVKA